MHVTVGLVLNAAKISKISGVGGIDEERMNSAAKI